MIKNIMFMVALACLAGRATAQFKPADKGSSVQFKIKNLGFTVNGSFSGLQGTINFDPSKPGAMAFDVSIDAGTVNTDNSMRDDHLRQETYFDVKNYPHIHFVSTKISPPDKKGLSRVWGKLTIRNQTKELSFPFTATPSGSGWLLKGSFTINRRDFGVGGASIIADELEVALTILGQ